MSVRRGGLYRNPPVGREFLVLSIDALNAAGTAIVAEVSDATWTGPRSMLTVPMAETDPHPGRLVLAWRVNWVRAERLGEHIGDVHPDTLHRVIAAVTAAIEP